MNSAEDENNKAFLLLHSPVHMSNSELLNALEEPWKSTGGRARHAGSPDAPCISGKEDVLRKIERRKHNLVQRRLSAGPEVM